MIELAGALGSLGRERVDVTLLSTERAKDVPLQVPFERLLPARRTRGGNARFADLMAKAVGRRLTTVSLGSASLAAVAERAELDVVHDLTGLAPIGRGAGPAAVVVTIHDLISLVGVKSNDPVDTFVQRHWLRRALRHADAVVSVSDSTSRDIRKHLAVPDDRLHVVPHGVSDEFHPRDRAEVASVLCKYGVRAPYVLTVGAGAERKNIRRLENAFASIRSVHPDLSLAITGRTEAALPGESQAGIMPLGYVDRDDLPALYSGAAVFAFPSLYEGFGLPVLEAMACGTPIVCGDGSSLPEVAGDAAVTVDVSSVEAIADGLLRVLSDDELCADLSKLGRERSGRFTWRACAEGTLDVYRSVMARSV
jgi:alpha-1,3-rhamnosyl/mannosyltransferase